MSELKENLEKVLEDYIDSLDNEEENRELLLKLKKASKDSIKARSYYREARINQPRSGTEPKPPMTNRRLRGADFPIYPA